MIQNCETKLVTNTPGGRCLQRRISARVRESYLLTVEMEGVGLAGRVRGHREGELDGGVGRERVEAAAGEEVCCALGAREDLEEDGNRGRNEGRAINEELGAVLSKSD